MRRSWWPTTAPRPTSHSSTRAFTDAGVPELGWLRRVDSFYLALSVWPFAPSHRLAELVQYLGVATDGLSWHDAQLAALLLREGAQASASWPAERRVLLRAVTHGSAAWELLTGLAEAFEDPDQATGKPRPRPFNDAEVARVLEEDSATDPHGGHALNPALPSGCRRPCWVPTAG